MQKVSMLRKEKKLKPKVEQCKTFWEKKEKKLITGQKFYWYLEKDYRLRIKANSNNHTS